MSETKPPVCPRSWGDGYRSGYEAGLEAASRAIMQHDKAGREWIMESLWGTLARECSERILELKMEKP